MVRTELTNSHHLEAKLNSELHKFTGIILLHESNNTIIIIAISWPITKILVITIKIVFMQQRWQMIWWRMLHAGIINDKSRLIVWPLLQLLWMKWILNKHIAVLKLIKCLSWSWSQESPSERAPYPATAKGHWGEPQSSKEWRSPSAFDTPLPSPSQSWSESYTFWLAGRQLQSPGWHFEPTDLQSLDCWRYTCGIQEESYRQWLDASDSAC